jgi:hypothetical protein
MARSRARCTATKRASGVSPTGMHARMSGLRLDGRSGRLFVVARRQIQRIQGEPRAQAPKIFGRLRSRLAIYWRRQSPFWHALRAPTRRSLGRTAALAGGCPPGLQLSSRDVAHRFCDREYSPAAANASNVLVLRKGTAANVFTPRIQGTAGMTVCGEFGHR